MKFPKLRHAGLCNVLIFLPAQFLFFAIGFNIPLANWGTPKWVLTLNFLLQEWKRSSLNTALAGRDQNGRVCALLRPRRPGGCADVYEAGGEKHLLLEKNPAAYGTSGKSRTRRRWITPEEQKSCRARIESWLVAEGYRFEAETEK